MRMAYPGGRHKINYRNILAQYMAYVKCLNTRFCVLHIDYHIKRHLWWADSADVSPLIYSRATISAAISSRFLFSVLILTASGYSVPRYFICFEIFDICCACAFLSRIGSFSIRDMIVSFVALRMMWSMSASFFSK